MQTLYLILKSARPRQWIKNLSLYAALIFSGFFFFVTKDGISYFLIVTYATIVFSILTSSVYIINDIVDYERDRKHPFKRKRPIASDSLPIPTAIFAAITGIFVVFLLSLALSNYFKLMIIAYFILQMFYAKKLKNVAILDVASIATGFLIRVYAGAVVVNLHMSVWFLLTVLSASLFLAVAKRQSERTLMQGKSLGETRKSLKNYSQRLLDQYTAMFGTATWLTYALYTFQRPVSAPTEQMIQFYSILPKTLRSQKLLMLSIPFAIFAVMRYTQLVYESNKGESPERVILSDKPIMITALLIGAIVMFVIYGLGSAS
ncbi:MAG: decaprenyl-phosphate phosphoribosyltransferase [Patescibacteria group bacterium]